MNKFLIIVAIVILVAIVIFLSSIGTCFVLANVI